MNRIDVLILAAVLVAAAGSAYGVLTYEDERSSEFRVTWSALEEVLETEPASLSGQGEVELALDVTFGNITTGEMAIGVTSSPGALSPTAVHVEITVPGLAETIVYDGEVPTASPGATFQIPVDLAPLPEETTLRAASPEDAQAQAAAAAASDVGRGAWRIVVSLSPTAPDPLGAVTHTVRATATLQTYDAEAVVLSPEVPR